MKRILILILPLFLLGCQSPSVHSIREQPIASATPEMTNSVKIENGQFNPSSIQVNLGESITIHNIDKAIWTLAADPHPSHSQDPNLFKILHRGESDQYQFVSAGSFGIHLEENPSVNLKIVVE